LCVTTEGCASRTGSSSQPPRYGDQSGPVDDDDWSVGRSVDTQAQSPVGRVTVYTVSFEGYKTAEHSIVDDLSVLEIVLKLYTISSGTAEPSRLHIY